MSCAADPKGCGTLFRIGNTGQFSVGYAFTGGPDGAKPQGQPILGTDGSIYSVAGRGGSALAGGDGCGTIYKYTP